MGFVQESFWEFILLDMIMSKGNDGSLPQVYGEAQFKEAHTPRGWKKRRGDCTKSKLTMAGARIVTYVLICVLKMSTLRVKKFPEKELARLKSGIWRHVRDACNASYYALI